MESRQLPKTGDVDSSTLKRMAATAKTPRRGRLAGARAVGSVAPVALDSTACAGGVVSESPAGSDRPAFGRDTGGSRYSPLTQISRENVARLEPAWTYRTGETEQRFQTKNEASLEVTPILVDGTLYLSTSPGRVIALDSATGAERWVFDPQIHRDVPYGDFTNRSVSTWLDPSSASNMVCARRIFVAPIDGRPGRADGQALRFTSLGPVGIRRAPPPTREYR